MKANDYLHLQIGMYVTDKWSLEKSDYCIIRQFDSKGRMKLQPLDNNGDPKGEVYWVHFKNYDLKDQMVKSEFIACTA